MGSPDPKLLGATDAALVGDAPWIVTIASRVNGGTSAGQALRFNGTGWDAIQIGTSSQVLAASIADASGVAAVAYADAGGAKLSKVVGSAIPDGAVISTSVATGSPGKTQILLRLGGTQHGVAYQPRGGGPAEVYVVTP